MPEYSISVLGLIYSFNENYGGKREVIGIPATPNQEVRSNSIVGRVFEEDIPISRRVSCYDRRTGQLTSQVWSNENGDYEFGGLPDDGRYYYIVTTDGNGGNTYYNAVVQDLIQAI